MRARPKNNPGTKKEKKGPTTHRRHCHQSTPSLLIYLLLIPPAQ
jgi:hypothetical protein